MNNPIPRHLRQYITEAIAAGHRTPDAILNAALDRCNAVLNEMHDGKTRRSVLVREDIGLSVWAAANDWRN